MICLFFAREPAREPPHALLFKSSPAGVICGCALALLSLLLTGCGGGGGGNNNGGAAVPPPATVTLSGTASFARVPAKTTGLDYTATIIVPIRGAIIQVRSANAATVLYQGVTDALGNWSISAPQNTPVLVTILAELGTPTNVTAKVVDNTTADAVYSVFIAKTTGTANESGIIVNAASGWTGSAYANPRTSGPFAILDTIYQAQQLIRSADPAVIFPLLLVGWSPANSAATVITSNFNPNNGRLTILGKENEDTDEFDTHVIAHEWGHYFEANFSRADSLGGPHGGGDILDETVALSEGWGNAFSGMVNRSPNYIDTTGPQQAAVGVALDVEANAIPTSATVGGRRLDGGWSEFSVQELLWDVFDGADGIADADADGVALGFTPIYRALTGPQRTFAGFTTIYSLMDFLKAQNPSSAAAITRLEGLENIGPHDAYQQTASGFARYTTVPNNGTALTTDIDGRPLQTYTTHGDITEDYFGNKLYNRLFFLVTAPATGTVRLRVTPLNATHDVIVLFGGIYSAAGIDAVYGGAEVADFPLTAGEVLSFSVGSFATPTNASGVTPFRIQFGTPAQVGKPQAGATATLPTSDG